MIDLVCWDFGDTLVDERWMRRPLPGHPGWAADYDEVLAENVSWVDAWHEGRASVDGLIDRLEAKTGVDRASIERHVAGSCRDVRFFPAPMEAVRELTGQVKQACTTVNPDVFSRYVVPAYHLDRVFDVIVTSWETGMSDKSAMARRARTSLGLTAGLGSTLLVDNKKANVREFVAAGGFAYHFRGEEAFTTDYGGGLAGLLAAAEPPGGGADAA